MENWNKMSAVWHDLFFLCAYWLAKLIIHRDLYYFFSLCSVQWKTLDWAAGLCDELLIYVMTTVPNYDNDTFNWFETLCLTFVWLNEAIWLAGARSQNLIYRHPRPLAGLGVVICSMVAPLPPPLPCANHIMCIWEHLHFAHIDQLFFWTIRLALS